jgi:hypothetical protein
VQPPAFTTFRFYSRPAEKSPLKLIANIRELTEVSITNACGEVLAALKWPRNTSSTPYIFLSLSCAEAHEYQILGRQIFILLAGGP